MGQNIMVLIVGGAVDQIATDAKFGERLAETIIAHERGHAHLDGSGNAEVRAGNFHNAAAVVANFHADAGVVILAGGNTAKVAAEQHGAWRFQDDANALRLLRKAAAELGYDLVPGAAATTDSPREQYGQPPQRPRPG